MFTEIKTLDNTVFTPPYDLPPKQTIYFDIETTGFSADVTALYLIGCIYYESGVWKLIQWFAEDKASEYESLEAFRDFLQNKKYLICYNGTTFDLPYLRRKYEKHNLDFNTDKFEIIDLYRIFSSYKKFLGLNGLKQKDIETYLDIDREDKFTGGELIEWYAMYLRLRFNDALEKEEIYSTLLLHNADDLVGLTKLTKLYNFLQTIKKLTDNNELSDIQYTIEANYSKLVFSTTIEIIFTKNIKFCKNDFCIEIIKKDEKINIILTLDILNTELKLFYKDYKNYYYLPKEDIIIHKNLAAFVDKENKKKATAINCYTKHSGNFIKIPKQLNLHTFKTDYIDKNLYALLDDKLLNSKENMAMIFKSILTYLIK